MDGVWSIVAPHRESCELQLRNDQIWENATNAANGNYNLDFLQSNVRKWTTARWQETKRQHVCRVECTRDGNAAVATMQLMGKRNCRSVERETEIREIQMEYTFNS